MDEDEDDDDDDLHIIMILLTRFAMMIRTGKLMITNCSVIPCMRKKFSTMPPSLPARSAHKISLIQMLELTKFSFTVRIVQIITLFYTFCSFDRRSYNKFGDK